MYICLMITFFTIALAHVLSVEFSRLNLLEFKPFNCSTCLSFWFGILLSIPTHSALIEWLGVGALTYIFTKIINYYITEI
jgi:hypothetical protein